MPVTYHREGAIGVITIDSPPVNALGQSVRAGLVRAAAQFAGDDQAGAAVMLCAGRTWVAGADISEFGKPPQSPFLPDVIVAIEALDKPVIAALHGTALGGGLELAMGCHARIAAPTARMGLPEVTLGLLPGAGGTQRLPRLIGLEPALEVITGAKPIEAARALDLGLIDAVAQGDLTEAALALAHSRAGTAPRRSRELPAPGIEPAAIDRRRADLASKLPGHIAERTALDVVAEGLALPFDQGMEVERAGFLALMDSPQRAALVHAFFAERAVAHLPQIKGVAPRPLDRIGVLGGGTMGAGIAGACLLAGLGVTLIERDAAAAERARATVTKLLDGAVSRGKMTPARRDTALTQSFATATDHDALAQADLIIEAVFESMGVKDQVFSALDRVAKPGAVLATNTSYLDVNRIAGATGRPADVIGLHFFSPAHVMRLLEVVVADRTAPDVVATGFALAKRLGKVAVRAGVCDGFIGNRILSHYRQAADAMVLDGATPAQIDRAMVAFGFAMGPYATLDLAGLDIGHATRQRRAATRHPRERVPVFADRLHDMGHLGRKTARGYYVYDGDRPRENPDLPALLDQVRADLGLTPRSFDDAEITARIMSAMVNEAARVVADGTALRPLDVDVVMLNGYGFPRWRGGPMHWADAHGLGRILADITRFAEDDDHFWQPAPLLADLAGQGARFADLDRKGGQ